MLFSIVGGCRNKSRLLEVLFSNALIRVGKICPILTRLLNMLTDYNPYITTLPFSCWPVFFYMLHMFRIVLDTHLITTKLLVVKGHQQNVVLTNLVCTIKWVNVRKVRSLLELLKKSLNNFFSQNNYIAIQEFLFVWKSHVIIVLI